MRYLDQLDISLEWEYKFHNKEKPIAPLPNQILIDLGGKLNYGVIDTDQGDHGYQSSVEALIENPHYVTGHLLKKVNEEYAAGRAPQVDKLELTFCTQSRPAWDNIASLYICDQLLRKGKLPGNVEDWLLDASNAIAQAKVKLEGDPKRPFIIYYAINPSSRGDEAYKSKLKSGFRLIERVIELTEEGKISTQDGGNPLLEPVENFSALFPEFSEEIKTIMSDRESFEEDMNPKHVDIFDVELPLKKPKVTTTLPSDPNNSADLIQESFEPCKAIAFQRPTKSKLTQFWVRDERDEEGKAKYDLIMTPYDLMTLPKRVRRWRIMVDQDSPYNLRRLGYLLEQEETMERPGDSRFEPDYCDNDDPWYDGRNHNYTFVSSPKRGTELSYEQIKTVITSRFHGIQLKPDKVDNLIFYFFYEIDDETKSSSELISVLDGHGFAESKPLEDLETAFQFVRDAKLRRLDIFKDQNDFFARVWASEITRHGILELEACDFYTVAPRPSSQPLILEELNERIGELQESALQLADKLKDMLPLKNDIWGNESYRLIKMCQPNLKFRNPDRVKLVFERMLNSDLDKEQISRLMTGNSKSEDIIRTSKALCVLGDEDVTTPSDIREYREPCILYALFLKTGYRNFSQRVGTIVDDLVSRKEKKPSEKESRRRLSLLQEDYSVFLGRYEFSEGEINLNRRVQAFFRKALEEMAFEEQKKETRHEMHTTYELAAAQERRAFEEQNKTLQTILIWVGVLAIGDFLYDWLKTSGNSTFSNFELGALLAAVLVGIAAFASWRIQK